MAKAAVEAGICFGTVPIVCVALDANAIIKNYEGLTARVVRDKYRPAYGIYLDLA
jgi:hypothetical protein